MMMMMMREEEAKQNTCNNRLRSCFMRFYITPSSVLPLNHYLRLHGEYDDASIFIDLVDCGILLLFSTPLVIDSQN